ncbi:MAG: hypothetical protein AAF638_08065 [Pseudomonadota bacterium]
MTIGIAAFGPKSGAGVLAGLQAVERVGRGAIGGFVSLAVLTIDGELKRATTQQGGAAAVLADGLSGGMANAPLAGLISSGPNRPEPLSDFVAADPGVGLVTGHRMPHTRAEDGEPLNRHVMAHMRRGLDPQEAIDRVLASYPDRDAGFLAITPDGKVGMGSTYPVLGRADQGSGLLWAKGSPHLAASIHNAIHPSGVISALANEATLDSMYLAHAQTTWIRMIAGIALERSDQSQISITPDGVVNRIFHPHRAHFSGEWSVGLGDRVEVLRDGQHVGWLGYEPFMTILDGTVQCVDGLDTVDVPVFDRLPHHQSHA